MKKKKEIVYKNATNLYNKLLVIYFNDYTHIKNEKMDIKYNPRNFFLKVLDIIYWKKKDEEKSKSQLEESIAKREKLRRQKVNGKDSSDMPSRNCGKEKLKEIKGLKILIPSKLLTWLPILLVQLKVGNNSYKLKNEIRKMLYIFYQHNKITKRVDCNLIKSL